MSRFVLLDSGPVGLVTGPHTLAAANACRAWLEDLLAARIEVQIPDITDYEVRRELLRARRVTGVQHKASQLRPIWRLMAMSSWRPKLL